MSLYKTKLLIQLSVLMKRPPSNIDENICTWEGSLGIWLRVLDVTGNDDMPIVHINRDKIDLDEYPSFYAVFGLVQEQKVIWSDCDWDEFLEDMKVMVREREDDDDVYKTH